MINLSYVTKLILKYIEFVYDFYFMGCISPTEFCASSSFHWPLRAISSNWYVSFPSTHSLHFFTFYLSLEGQQFLPYSHCIFYLDLQYRQSSFPPWLLYVIFELANLYPLIGIILPPLLTLPVLNLVSRIYENASSGWKYVFFSYLRSFLSCFWIIPSATLERCPCFCSHLKAKSDWVHHLNLK